MIQDSARVTMPDGTYRAAVDLPTGGAVLSYRSRGALPTKIEQKNIVVSRDVICLILSNGRRLCGSRDLKVACYTKNNSMYFRSLADIGMGDEVVGNEEMTKTRVKVIGLMYQPKQEVRLVGLTTERNGPFIAEGVLCRS